MLRRIVTASAALALTAGLAAGPASAHHDGTTNVHDATTVTFNLTGNGLAIDAPLSASANGAPAPLSQVTATLGSTTVSDQRGSLAGWTVTATASDLVDGTKTIPASAMRWNAVEPTAVVDNALGTLGSVLNGNVRVVSAGAGGVFGGATPVVVALATPGFGTGSYSYGGSITLTVPLGAQAGNYSSTVTQTVA